MIADATVDAMLAIVSIEALGFVLLGFLVGSIPFGVLVSRVFYKRDIRDAGSGNIGAANALRTLGKGGAVAVLLLDMLKGFVPTSLAFDYFGPAGGWIAAAVALAAVLGHCFSPFLGFRGGKGVATSLGAICALAYPAAIAFAIVWVAVFIGCSFASLASMIASLAMPFALWFMIGEAGAAYGAASAVVIIVMHRQNLARLRSGTESRLSLFGPRNPGV